MRTLSDTLARRRALRALARRVRAIRSHPDRDPAVRRSATLAAVLEAPIFPPRTPHLKRADLPIAFWESVLGGHLSATSAFWPRWAKDIDRAETEWLELVANRAELAAGQRVLELGGSLGAVARWSARELPDLEMTVLAADGASKPLLDAIVAAHGPAAATLAGTALDEFSPDARFDRILALEAFGGTGNPVPLFERLLSWLEPGGRLFLQTVCHWRATYTFVKGDEHRWMLFDVPDGALMPGEELFTALEDHLPVLDRWELSGEHYERTARAWRGRMEGSRAELERILSASGDRQPSRTFETCRRAFLGQESMFGFREGQEWALTQILMGEPKTPIPSA